MTTTRHALAAACALALPACGWIIGVSEDVVTVNDGGLGSDADSDGAVVDAGNEAALDAGDEPAPDAPDDAPAE